MLLTIMVWWCHNFFSCSPTIPVLFSSPYYLSSHSPCQITGFGAPAYSTLSSSPIALKLSGHNSTPSNTPLLAPYQIPSRIALTTTTATSSVTPLVTLSLFSLLFLQFLGVSFARLTPYSTLYHAHLIKVSANSIKNCTHNH